MSPAEFDSLNHRIMHMSKSFLKSKTKARDVV